MNNLKYVVLMSVTLRFPPLHKLATQLVPQKVIQDRLDHRSMSKEKVERRLEKTTDRPDFMSYIMRHNGTRVMSRGGNPLECRNLHRCWIRNHCYPIGWRCLVAAAQPDLHG